MKVPEIVHAGDKVAIVAPARKINSAEVEYASSVISSWGLQVVIGKNIYRSETYLAASDRQRLEDLQEMINDPAIKVIFCARGGYGMTRIVDQLDVSALKIFPKWIVGFSDITALHLRLAKERLISIHATMPVLFRKPGAEDSIQSLKQVLFGGSFAVHAEPNSFNRFGQATGRMVGGNLSLVVESLGTKTEVDTIKNILFIEEIDEPIYKVDRMITQLLRAGKFEKLSGLVVGHMTDIQDTEVPFGMGAEEVILHAVRDFSFPVAFRIPSGHENPNLAWLHGAVTSLTVQESGIFLSSQKIIGDTL